MLICSNQMLRCNLRIPRVIFPTRMLKEAKSRVSLLENATKRNGFLAVISFLRTIIENLGRLVCFWISKMMGTRNAAADKDAEPTMHLMSY